VTPLDLLKLFAAPGSVSFLVLACAVGLTVIYVWPRQRALGRGWLYGVFIAYIVLACPYVARAITATLPPLADPGGRALTAIDTLVVFDGDNRRGRLRETMTAYRTLGPATVLVSAQEDWLVEHLIGAGIPADRIHEDRQSATTREQMEMIAALASKHAVAIVASRLQMPRVAALARQRHMTPMLLAAPVDTEPPTGGLRALIPSYAALRVSRDAFYERVALSYYSSRGWIGTPP